MGGGRETGRPSQGIRRCLSGSGASDGPSSGARTAAGRGEVVTVILEHKTGIAIVSVLSPEAILLVLMQPSANIGQLLYELRRNRRLVARIKTIQNQRTKKSAAAAK